MTLLCNMCQMQNGIHLGMVALLKCCKVTMLDGDHGLEAGTPEQFSVHVSLGDLCADEREQLLFLVLILRNPLSSHASELESCYRRLLSVGCSHVVAE